MKKFRILGILAILVIVGDFAISFTAGWQEERDSFLAGRYPCGGTTSGNNNIGFIA